MAQFNFGNLVSPLSGVNLIDNNLEPWRDALHSLHSGVSRPSYAVAGTMWLDTATTPWVMKVFDGTDDISIGTVNASTNEFIADNTVAKDGDTLTGSMTFNGAGLGPVFNSATGTNAYRDYAAADGSYRLERWNGSAWVTVLTAGADGNIVIGGTTAVSSSRLTVTGASLSVNSSDGNFAAGNARSIMDFASGISRLGSVDGGDGSNPSTHIIANNATSIQCGASGGVQFPRISTTASSANAFLDSGFSNNLLRSTSSARYKKDIETLDEWRSDDIVNGLRPVWYRSQAESDNPDWGWYGLIAEEVAEVEPALVHWTYPYKTEIRVYKALDGQDENGNEIYKEVEEEVSVPDTDQPMFPDAVQYERLTVFLLDKVKRQQDQIDALMHYVNQKRLDGDDLPQPTDDALGEWLASQKSSKS